MSRKKNYFKGDFMSVRNSRKLYFPIYFMVIILVLAVIIIKFNELPLNKTAFFAVIIFIILALKATEIHRLKHKYEIKPPSLIHIEGYFSKIARRVDLFAISDVDASQTSWQRLLGYGDVNVRLFSKESTTQIKNINHPNEFAEFLEKKMFEQRKGIKKNVPYG